MQVANTLSEQVAVAQRWSKVWAKKEKDMQDDIQRLQGDLEKVELARTELRSEIKVANRSIDRLEKENKDITTAIADTKARLEKLGASPSASLEEFKAEIHKLRSDIDAMQKALAANSYDIAAYKKLLEDNQNKPNELILLTHETRQLLHGYEAMLHEATEQKEILLLRLAEKEKEIETLKTSLAAEARKASKVANDEEDLVEDTWEQLYRDKTERYEKLEEALNKRHAQAQTKLRNNLEQKNKELLARFTQSQDEKAQLEAQIMKLQDSAANWEAEFRELKIRHNLQRDESEQEIEKLKVETSTALTEYQNEMPTNNPDWWDVTKLQRQVRDLERRLQRQVDASIQQKEALGTSYDAYAKLKEQNSAFRQELGLDEDFQPSTRTRRLIKPRRPDYESAEATAAREKILDEYREKQAGARRKREAERELIEKARKWKMGDRYPPNHPETYDAIKSKTARERWEVDQYERLVAQGLIQE